MSLEIITNINVDFYEKQHILIHAKQYDKNSRFLSVTCCNHGNIFPISANEHSAYVRHRKPDGNGVFNLCEIDSAGKIIVELTEQMLAAEGVCCADLVITNKGSANIDVDTGEIITIDNAAILSTMTFYIDVSETTVANSNIESSYEFNGLNMALEKADAEYTRVIQLSKSYAIGNADGIRENEDYDNAKYYYEQSLNNAESALGSANKAQSYAVGGTGTRTNEDNDNAKYYYELIKNVVVGLDSGFIPMGTISFDELASAERATGYVYNISTDFITDESFREGSGKSYTAGVNVYYTADGYWDCFGGMSSPAATVDEVKDYLGI